MPPHPSTRQSDRLLLLDTASLYFRAFYGVPTSLTAPDGTPMNAVRGLLDMVAALVTDLSPTRLVACWDDDWRPQFRVRALPGYKAHRLAAEAAGAAGHEDTPAELSPQVPVIAEMLEALGIARVGSPGYEADDVIATLVQRELDRRETGHREGGQREGGQAGSAGAAVDVVTGDRDLFQLVDDEREVRVLYTARGVRRHQVVDAAVLRERYGVASGSAYADMALLRGDPSDGLPGVAGIGDKTAADLVRRYGDLAGVQRALEAGDPGLSRGVRARLHAAGDYLRVAPVVVRVARDAPLPPFDDALPREPADAEAVVDLSRRWGLDGSVERVLRAFAGAARET